MPGTVDFCPLIFKTEKLKASISANISEQQNSFFNKVHKDIVQRASSFLLLKDSKASFSIEGENPLYLPQAKMYEGCAALGPCIYVPDQPISPDASIEISIERNNVVMFSDRIAISQMKRTHSDLVSYLYKECSFPNGCFLMTGTGIVPPNSFTLQSGDSINITIEHIGTLKNTVA